MAATDRLRFNDCAIFAKLRASFEAGGSQSRDLIDSKDDLIFGWDQKDNCVLAFNWRSSLIGDSEAAKFQTLIPSVPQYFEVDRLVASNDCNYIALSGLKGVTVIELPLRFGPDGNFLNNKNKITCRSTNLDENLFSNNPQLEVCQLRWHPDSRSDSRLLVLLSDNTIRVYDHARLCHVWTVGPVQLQNIIPSGFDLGEYAVDFDFAPVVKAKRPQTHFDSVTRRISTISADLEKIPFSKSKEIETSLAKSLRRSLSLKVLDVLQSTPSHPHCEWPIVLLRGNGNIYVLMAAYDSPRPRLQGPLTITPGKRDNYGLESCALIVIPSTPPTLIFAESNGKLHHGLLIENEQSDDHINDIDSTISIYPTEYSVHVLETVELELGIQNSNPRKSQFYCPFNLKKDITNGIRYFTYHSTGLHSVTLNFLDQLQNYLSKEVASDLSFFNTPSTAEYLVCTEVGLKENVNAVMGFTILQVPNAIVLFLGSGQVISLQLLYDESIFFNQYAIKSEKREPMPQVNIPCFINHIKDILKRTVTQPILSANKQPDARLTLDCLDMLNQSLTVLRSQYVERIQSSQKEITKKLHYIYSRQEKQRLEVEDLERERETISERAHRLAESFEDINDKHQTMLKRVRELMHFMARLPRSSLTGADLTEQVNKICCQTKNLEKRIESVKSALKMHNTNIVELNSCATRNNFVLPDKQESAIKEILASINIELEDQIKTVKQAKGIMNCSSE